VCQITGIAKGVVMAEDKSNQPEHRPPVTLTRQVTSARPGVRPDAAATTYWPIEVIGNGLWNQGFNFPSGIVTPDSNVFANICELTSLGGTPFIGAATMRINNIAPGNDFVEVQIEVDWNWPLTIRIQFEIAPPEPTL
jgi:hypothetical protein